MDVHIGKMLLTAWLLNCLEPVLTIAAGLSNKSPFFSPPSPSHLADTAYRAHCYFTNNKTLSPRYRTTEKLSSPLPNNAGTFSQKTGKLNKVNVDIGNDSSSESDMSITEMKDIRVSGSMFTTSNKSNKKEKERDNNNNEGPVLFSDHIAMVRAFDEWEHMLLSCGAAAAHAFCVEKFLTHAVLVDMRALKELFRRQLQLAGFGPSSSSSSSSHLTTSFELCHDDNDNDGDDGDAEHVTVASQNRLLGNISGFRMSTSSSDVVSILPSVEWALVRCALCAGEIRK